jgi:negative elongation factor B
MTADVPAPDAMDVDNPEPSGKSSGEGEAGPEPAASDGQNLVDTMRQLEDDPSSEDDVEHEDLAAGGSSKKKVLVGGEGADFVAAELGRNPDVADAIKRIQEQGALKTVGIDRERDAEPLLGLLGQLGMTRAEVYRHTLDDALKELRDRIESMPQGTLLSLLDASFPYIGIEELKAIPLTALEHLKPVPSSYLKQISRNVELFRQLPVEVQRQCWELRGELLRRHTTPALLAYAEETATVMRNLDQDLSLAPLNAAEGFAIYMPGTAPAQSGPKPPPGLPRASLRRASASVQRLKRVIGDSKKLYLGAVANARMHYAEHGSAGACSLRSQLLMSLHDDEKTGLCDADRCHRLAWLADACVRDRCLDGRRCGEIVAIVTNIDFDAKAGERAAKKAAASKKKPTVSHGRKMPTRRAPPPKLPTLKFTFGKKKEEEPKKEDDAKKEEAAPAPEPSGGGGNTDVGAPNHTASDGDGVSDAPRRLRRRGPQPRGPREPAGERRHGPSRSTRAPPAFTRDASNPRRRASHSKGTGTKRREEDRPARQGHAAGGAHAARRARARGEAAPARAVAVVPRGAARGDGQVLSPLGRNHRVRRFHRRRQGRRRHGSGGREG